MTHIASVDTIRPNFAGELARQVKPVLRYALGVAATASLALLADSGIEYFKRRQKNTPTAMRTDFHEGSHTTYTIPGCRTDGLAIGDMLEPQLSRLGNTHNLSYGEGQIDIDIVKQRLLESKSVDGENRASIIALSMGGLVLAKAFHDPEFAEQFGPIDSVILDSSPSGMDDIKPAAKIAMRAASTLRSSYSASKISGWAMLQRAIRDGEASHDDYVTDEQTMHHLKTTAYTPLSTVHNQSRFIESSKLEEGSLSHLNISNIYYISSENDPVIETDQAIKSYEAAFGRNVIHIIDSSRPAKSHAVIPEYQEIPTMLLGNSKQDFALA